MTAARYISLFIAFTSICVAQNKVSKVVTIAQGPVRGYKVSDSEVYEFFGIPYATAPNGTDKFKAPLEAPSWIQTLEAVDSTIAYVPFAYPILRSVKLLIESGSDLIYLYEYTFYEKFLPIEGVPDVLVNFPGADHCAQTEAILDITTQKIQEEDFTDKYRLMRAQIRELWLNFIITGNPVPEGSTFPAWPPTNASRTPYMILGETIGLGESLNEQRAQFWDDIYDQYYRHPKQPTEPTDSENSASTLSKSMLLCFFTIYNLFF